MSKFLIENDVGLALDKVNSVINMIRSEEGFDTSNLEHMDDTLIETLAHLAQALENLEKLEVKEKAA